LLFGVPGAVSPHEAFFYFRRNQLQAIRSGAWKFHLPLGKTYPAWDTNSRSGKGRPAKLVNLDEDLQEAQDLGTAHPEIVTEMMKRAREVSDELGVPGRSGTGQRRPKDLENPKPLLLGER
jgi:arylsulfatase A-like enzyme